ncbi:CBS domain-containing protein [Actinomycetospora sp. NBRC 106375]|uniref:CBS domain-containing protein n=1 Tax=Actinomycetospora sp. NBRC 106375 TaxID=3032207 RepID=UPI0024A39DCE|nr:CBS domain-containing protein [Actinomycetospora sp. NBRC 106375]GLZ49641.1 CBS domain-containing protein [Actinomycetospora sp. NBRC 106375]
MRVQDVMTRTTVTVGPDTPVHAAAELLVHHGFTLLPVLAADGVLVGVIGESDVLRGRVLDDPRSGGADDDPPPPRTVREVMTRDVRTVSAWSDVADAVAPMIDRGLRSLPVVSEGALVGIVTRRDVAGVLARSDEDLRAAVSRRLDTYAGWHRWDVHADRGEVVLCDEEDDPLQQHIATVIAAGVPGTVHVATHRRDRCPAHGSAA